MLFDLILIGLVIVVPNCSRNSNIFLYSNGKVIHLFHKNLIKKFNKRNILSYLPRSVFSWYKKKVIKGPKVF